MDPSLQDISAGQKAYQGLVANERFRVAQRSKLSQFLNVVMVLVIAMQILADFQKGKYWMTMLFVAALLSLLWGLRIMEKTKRKNLEVLRQLKIKYGPEIYEEIKKEPDSLQHKLFQKSYLFKLKSPSVELP